MFQKPSPGFAYAFISGEAKMEQIIDKLQTNTGREGTKPTASCCCFLRRQGGGHVAAPPFLCRKSIPASPGNKGVSPGLPHLETAAFNSMHPRPGTKHAQLPNLLPQLTATNNSVRSGPAKAKPYGCLHSSTAKNSNSQSQWPPLPLCS